MGGTLQHGDDTPHPDAAAAAEVAQAVAPLLEQPAVWIDPPPELGDEVVDSVRSELD